MRRGLAVRGLRAIAAGLGLHERNAELIGTVVLALAAWRMAGPAREAPRLTR